MSKIRELISNAYYEARNARLTMEIAADNAATAVEDLIAERIQHLKSELENYKKIVERHNWCEFSGQPTKQCARSVCDCGYEWIVHELDREKERAEKVTLRLILARKILIEMIEGHEARLARLDPAMEDYQRVQAYHVSILGVLKNYRDAVLGNAVCTSCSQEMNAGVSCTQYAYSFEGRGAWPRVPAALDCVDCKAPADGLHHPGCDAERCALCKGQAISCGC